MYHGLYKYSIMFLCLKQAWLPIYGSMTPLGIWGLFSICWAAARLVVRSSEMHQSQTDVAGLNQAQETINLLSLFTKRPAAESRKRKAEHNSDNVSSSSARSVKARSETPGHEIKLEDRPSFSVVVPPLPAKSGNHDRGLDSLSLSKQSTSVNTSERETSEDTRSSDTSTSIQPTGLSTKFYPTDAYETRARRGAYPRAKKVNRQDIPPLMPLKTSPVKMSPSKPLSKRRHLRQTLEDKLAAIKGPPVTLADKGSNAGLASNFEFISSYKLQKGVERVDDSFNAGCDCGPMCNPKKCTCLSQELDSEDLMIPYRRLENGLLVLSRDFLKKTSMIYECSSHCSCNKDCWNRVVQHGRTIRLEIFHTGSRGFGKLVYYTVTIILF